MSEIAQFLFESTPLSCTADREEEEASNDVAGEELEESVSLATNNSGSSYGDMVEGMVIGMLDRSSNDFHREGEDSVTTSTSMYEGQTVVSSVSSGDFQAQPQFPPTRATIAPRESFSASHPLSISTCPSLFLSELDNEWEIDHEEQEEERPAQASHDLDPLSLQSSLLDDSFSFPSVNQSPNISEVQEFNTAADASTSTYGGARAATGGITSNPPFSTSAAVVLRQASPFTIASNAYQQRNRPCPATKSWFSSFTEEDWTEFRKRALLLVEAVTLPPSTATSFPGSRYQLPPRPPPPASLEDEELLVPATEGAATVDASQVLQSCFVCPLCQDAIVGALTLDCDCGVTVCMACWEYRCTVQTRDIAGDGSCFDFAHEYGYTIVPQHANRDSNTRPKQERCPCCCQIVQNPLPSHALDVALLHVVRQLGGRNRSFQRSYYKRLWEWRDEITRRQEEYVSNNDNANLEQYIAELISEEEDKLWLRHSNAIIHQRRFSFPSLAGVIIATAASIGIKILAQSRQ